MKLIVAEAFKVALTTLKKTNIDLNKDPCEVLPSGSEWSTINRWKDIVTCDCSFVNGTICHVTKMCDMSTLDDLTYENMFGFVELIFVNIVFGFFETDI